MVLASLDCPKMDAQVHSHQTPVSPKVLGEGIKKNLTVQSWHIDDRGEGTHGIYHALPSSHGRTNNCDPLGFRDKLAAPGGSLFSTPGDGRAAKIGYGQPLISPRPSIGSTTPTSPHSRQVLVRLCEMDDHPEMMMMAVHKCACCLLHRLLISPLMMPRSISRAWSRG